ncbi:MAG: hypothetical protein KAY58_02080 [Desulfobulbus sp.]|nr:hypothetical protein [Desulfobulbus sp.]
MDAKAATAIVPALRKMGANFNTTTNNHYLLFLQEVTGATARAFFAGLPSLWKDRHAISVQVDRAWPPLPTTSHDRGDRPKTQRRLL